MKQSSTDQRFLMVCAAAGAVVCIGSVATFFTTMVNNHLPWEHAPTASDHYLAVGKSYSQGFTIGFFLAFSLALVAISVAAWADDRRKARGGKNATRVVTRSRLVMGMTTPTQDVA